MKKVIKSLSIICLALLMICPLALVGCSKIYIITIEASAGGNVYKKDYEGITVKGSNEVEKGEKFEYYVKANTGYEIESITIDGSLYTESYDKNQTYLSFENVDKDHSVTIVFKALPRTIILMCKNDSNSNYIQFGDPLTLNKGETIDFNNYGGVGNKNWYKKIGNNNYYLYNDSTSASDDVPAGYVSNVISYSPGVGNIVVYTDLTETEVRALFN